VEALAKASVERVLQHWEGLGYYARVRNAHAAARLIVRMHGGKFPRTFEEVLALPGVGRYTAGAVCSIAFNLPAAVLDGNVMRVLSRVYGVEGDTRAKEPNGRLWELAQELVGIADCELRIADRGSGTGGNCQYKETKETQAEAGVAGTVADGAGCGGRGRNCGRLNEALMELGALVCTPGAPPCGVCPLRRECFARLADRVGEFPALKAAGKTVRRRFAAFIVKRNGRFLARQRPAGGVNAHLWEFPNVEFAPGRSDLEAAARPFVVVGNDAVCRVRHTITRNRILLEAYRAELPRRTAKGNAFGVWRTPEQLGAVAMTAAHRKILEALRG